MYELHFGNKQWRDRGYLQICHIQVEDRLPKDGPLSQNSKLPFNHLRPFPAQKINEYITPYFLPIFFFYYFETEQPKRASVEGMDTSPPKESIVILIRDESDINTIK